MKIKEVAKTKTPLGFVEILYKTARRYYRIVRTMKGNMYSIYVNNSEYGDPQYDEPMVYSKRTVREYTIYECKESIEVYEMLEDLGKL